MSDMSQERVLCLVTTDDKFLEDFWDQEWWLDDEQIQQRLNAANEKIIPLIDHPHSDRENGQEEIHYHVDDRYGMGLTHVNRISLPLAKNQRLKYYWLRRKKDVVESVTSPSLIANSKLKHKCLHKGKCPHRGYNMTNVKAVDGVKTCPLHGLKFNSEGNLINDPQKLG